MKYLNIVVFSLLLGNAISVSAGVTKSTAKQVGAVDANLGMIYLDVGLEDVSTLPECAAINDTSRHIFMFHMSGDDASHGRSMMSVALSGLMSGKNLVVTYSQTTCATGTQRALATRIDVQK